MTKPSRYVPAPRAAGRATYRTVYRAMDVSGLVEASFQPADVRW